MLDDRVKDFVGTEIIELFESSVDSLWVLQSHVCILVSLVHSLGLAIEDDLFDLGGVNLLRVLAHLVLVGKSILKHALFASDLTSVVSVLLEFDQQPLDHADQSTVIAS